MKTKEEIERNLWKKIHAIYNLKEEGYKVEEELKQRRGNSAKPYSIGFLLLLFSFICAFVGIGYFSYGMLLYLSLNNFSFIFVLFILFLSFVETSLISILITLIIMDRFNLKKELDSIKLQGGYNVGKK